MKSLDDVIKAFEWCLDDANDDCPGCPYYAGRDTDCHDINVDALHYLREYQVEKNKSGMDRLKEVLREVRGEI